MSDVCGTLTPILRVVIYLLKLIQWVIPIILIVLATFDFFKSITSNEDKNMERAKSTVPRRLLYAVIIFLVPTVVRLLFRIISDNLPTDDLNGPASWIQCFEKISGEV